MRVDNVSDLGLGGDAEPVADGEDLLEDRARDRERLRGRHFAQVFRNVIGGRFAVRLGEPALTEADKHPGKTACAGRVVLMAELTSPTCQENDDRYHQLGLDYFQKSSLLKGFGVADCFGDHPRKPEGKHRVGQDSVLGAFNGDDVRQANESGFGRSVMSFQRLAEHPARRGDENEPAVALSLHHAVGGLAEIKTAVQVHAEHASPVLGRQILERNAVEDPRVADDRINAAEMVDCRAHYRLAAFAAVDRIVRGHRDATGALNLVDNLIGDARIGTFAVHGATEIVDHQRRTTTRQLHRVESPETATGSGDDGDLVVKVNHFALLLSGSRCLPSRSCLTAVTPDLTVEQIFGQPYCTWYEAKKDSLPADHIGNERLERLGILASAISGRALQVVPVDRGEPTWTDGTSVFVDADADLRHQLEALAVQASLLAAGSLAPDVVRRLYRRPASARRYLAIEGHRALLANDDLLPPVARSLVDCNTAARSDSATASLALAQSRAPIADPPNCFGAIHVRRLLASANQVEKSETGAKHAPRARGTTDLTEVEDDHTDDVGDVIDMFSSPVGGSGAIGRFFKRLTAVVRQLNAGGPPGADAPTHRTRAGTRGGGKAVVSTKVASTTDESGSADYGIKYPEWDVHRRRYRPNWCTVQEVEPRLRDATSVQYEYAHRLRRPLSRLALSVDRCRRQVQGDDIDIDAAVEARAEVLAGSTPDEAVYFDNLRRRRDLAVLLLLDISGSVAEPAVAGQTVHELQCAAAGALTVGLHDLGDRVALYAFHSRGRAAVQLMPVKRFDDGVNAVVMRRLAGLTPGAYSRLGAAIRHGAAVLETQGGTSRRLLVVLSDGLAYDHGYERVYGAADARRALAEARRRGTGCLCLTIGAGTDVDDLRRVFGSAAHATIPRLEQLADVIGPLFRSALRSADVRRRVDREKASGR